MMKMATRMSRWRTLDFAFLPFHPFLSDMPFFIASTAFLTQVWRFACTLAFRSRRPGLLLKRLKKNRSLFCPSLSILQQIPTIQRISYFPLTSHTFYQIPSTLADCIMRYALSNARSGYPTQYSTQVEDLTFSRQPALHNPSPCF